MYGINKKVYEELIEYFKNSSTIDYVILFGSRAKGLEKINSDIDLCIKCEDKNKGEIEDDINDIIGIYSCDIVFADNLNGEIENQIKRDGIKIYSK